MLMGNLCLLINTLAMSFYYILAKQVVQKYHALLVAAWAYLTGGWVQCFHIILLAPAPVAGTIGTLVPHAAGCDCGSSRSCGLIYLTSGGYVLLDCSLVCYREC